MVGGPDGALDDGLVTFLFGGGALTDDGGFVSMGVDSVVSLGVTRDNTWFTCKSEERYEYGHQQSPA